MIKSDLIPAFKMTDIEYRRNIVQGISCGTFMIIYDNFQLQWSANRDDGGSWTGGREDGSAQGTWPGGGAQLGNPGQTSPGYPVMKI